MSQALASQAFFERLDAVRFRRLRVNIARLVIRSLLLTALGVACLAAIDYWCELDRSVRQPALCGLLAGIVIQLAFSFRSLFRRSQRPGLAVEIEQSFPALGQSVRTAVEFGDSSSESVTAAGTRSSLVAALARQVDRATNSLPMESLIPTGRMLAALAVTLLAFGLLGTLSVRDWQWRTALGHALLDESPYTRMEVTPGTASLEHGKEFSIGIQVTGRTNHQVVLFTRPLTESEDVWQEREISAHDLRSSATGQARYAVKLPQINEPFSYRVAVGKLMSDEYQVAVRYPLRLQKVEVELTPPAYTGIEPSTITDGNVQATEGTAAVFRFQLDRAPSSARILLQDPRERPQTLAGDAPTSQEWPFEIDGATLTFPLELTASKDYVLIAESADGAKLPEVTYSIRVRPDHPPQIAFKQPQEVLEVHGLAEVLMRIQTQDDFGLTKAGVVFRVNNEAEYTLFQHDFETAAADLDESVGDGKRRVPVTAAVLAKFLPLEHFELTQKDSVTYYAFVEDNYPGGPRRTETDLRFIDIRPFQRNFQRTEPGSGGGGSGPSGIGSDGKPLPVLSELIARQRMALNRTRQIVRRSASRQINESASLGLSVLEKLVEFQQKLTASTHDLAEALQYSRHLPR